MTAGTFQEPPGATLACESAADGRFVRLLTLASGNLSFGADDHQVGQFSHAQTTEPIADRVDYAADEHQIDCVRHPECSRIAYDAIQQR